jgi:hypothetical protein
MRDTRSIRELIACQKPGWSLEQRFYTDPGNSRKLVITWS